MEKNRKYCLVILCILFLSAFIRIYDLSTESLWKDEALNLMTASKETIPDLFRNLMVVHINHPPLYSLILHYWGSFFGFSEFSIRFISIIFGIGVVFMVYLLSMELFDRKTSIIAMIISAISTTNLVYSQEAKQYSMFAFFVLLSAYFLVKMIKNESKQNTYLLLYFISSILMFYTHAIGIIFFFIQAIFLILFEQRLFFSRKTILFEITSFILTIPILFFVLKDVFETQKEIIPALHNKGVPSLIAELGYLNLLWPALMLGIIFLIFYLKFKKTKGLCRFYSNFENYIKNKSKKNNIILFLSILPILIYIAYGIFVNLNFPYPYFITKYPYFMLAFIHIFIGRNLITLNSKKIFWFLIALMVMVDLFMIFNFYTVETKSDWETATEVIRENIKDSDIIAYSSYDNIAPFLYYFPNKPFNYSDIPYPIYNYATMEEFAEDKIWTYPVPKNEALFLMKEKMEERNGGVWVVQYYAPELRSYFDEFTNKHFILKYKKNFDDKNRLILSYYVLI